jgi:hypothetical protein
METAAMPVMSSSTVEIMKIFRSILFPALCNLVTRFVSLKYSLPPHFRQNVVPLWLISPHFSQISSAIV